MFWPNQGFWLFILRIFNCPNNPPVKCIEIDAVFSHIIYQLIQGRRHKVSTGRDGFRRGGRIQVSQNHAIPNSDFFQISPTLFRNYWKTIKMVNIQIFFKSRFLEPESASPEFLAGGTRPFVPLPRVATLMPASQISSPAWFTRLALWAEAGRSKYSHHMTSCKELRRKIRRRGRVTWYVTMDKTPLPGPIPRAEFRVVSSHTLDRRSLFFSNVFSLVTWNSTRQ